MIFEVTDLSLPELAVYTNLTEHQLRSWEGAFIAESPKVIKRALAADCKPVSFLMERRHLNGQGAELTALCPDVPVYTADRAVLATLTGYELTRGILCAMERPRLPSLEEVCASAHRVAVLEGVVDATNVGAIFRSAAAMHMDAVILSPTCCDPLCRRAARVSMGTVFQIPWTRLGDDHTQWPHPGMDRLQALGFKTAALALTDASVSIEDERLKKEEKLALLLGTEGDGLSENTIAACDYTVKIPMSHGVDSLNVAAAGAVAFWELRLRT